MPKSGIASVKSLVKAQDDLSMKITKMLITGAMTGEGIETAAMNAQIIYRKLKPLTVDLFHEYSRKVDPSFKVIDATTADFVQWSSFQGIENTGMRKKNSIQSHGIVRSVQSNGWIVERTCNQGSLLGLNRQVYYDKVSFGLYVGSRELAKVVFNMDLEETYRQDQNGYLSTITPESISL